MVKTADHTKRERRRERAEAKEAARRRQQRRRRLGWTLGAAAVVSAIAIGGIALLGGAGDPGTGPSPRAEVVAGPARSEPLARGEAVPDFRAPELRRGTISWESYVGRPTLLAVWAPWCPHCQVELPILDRVMRDHPSMGFVTLVTAVGDRPGPTPEAYMRDHGLTFPVAVDDDAGTISHALGVPGFPMLYFVDSDGTVRFAVSGEVDEAALVEALSRLS